MLHLTSIQAERCAHGDIFLQAWLRSDKTERDHAIKDVLQTRPMLTETPTLTTRLTPARLEAQYASVPPTAVPRLLAMLRADPAWTVTEWTAGGRLVQVELLYHPSGEAFTLRRTQRDQEPSGGAGQ